jgi:hypothetical protein
MNCHISGHLQLLYIDTKTSFLTEQLIRLKDHQGDTKILIQLFESSLIPSDHEVEVSSSFRALPRQEKVKSSSIFRLQTKIKDLSDQRARFPRAIWNSDFDAFFHLLLHEARSNMIPKINYCLPLQSEVSFSRFLVSPSMRFTAKVAQLGTIPANEFSSGLTRVVAEILHETDLGEITKSELSLSQFLLHRNIFDVCYVLRGNLWDDSPPELLSKIFNLRLIRASAFELPPEVLSRPPLVDESICDFVLSVPELRKPAETLSLLLFMSNPLDVLYYVTLSLGEMREGALANRERLIPDPESPNLSWDATFSLFLVVFLASDVIDVFAVQKFVSEFAPKPLSSMFEYSKLMLDSLAIHFREIDPMEMS